jgi:hypothetical protein
LSVSPSVFERRLRRRFIGCRMQLSDRLALTVALPQGYPLGMPDDEDRVLIPILSGLDATISGFVD